MKPLNPTLYDALRRAFRHVRISNEGQLMKASYLMWGGKERLRPDPSSRGEYYIICCPYCHDTSFHLYINHRWGVRDPRNGTRNLWLACCFKSDCLREWENRDDLAERLHPYNLAQPARDIPVIEAAGPTVLGPMELPRDHRLLTELPKGHPARNYVRRRGFKPTELAELWGIGFSSDEYREYPGRLVIPFRVCMGDYFEPADLANTAEDPDIWEVVGYQGRLLGDPRSGQPKYLTKQGTRKSEVVYGIERVPFDDQSAVIVCEGPTDVWRAGPGAVAILGKSISPVQQETLRDLLPGRDIVVMLDPDAAAAAEIAADRIRAVLARDLRGGPVGRVVIATLPDDRDPGDCTRDEIWQAASAALAKQRRKAKKPASR